MPSSKKTRTSKRSLRRQSAGGSHKKSKSRKSKSRSGSKKGKMADDMARCMKCKKGIKPNGATKKTLPNGRCALTGTCPHCKTKVFKFCKC